jgi:hypothetical protein
LLYPLPPAAPKRLQRRLLLLLLLPPHLLQPSKSPLKAPHLQQQKQSLLKALRLPLQLPHLLSSKSSALIKPLFSRAPRENKGFLLDSRPVKSLVLIRDETLR